MFECHFTGSIWKHDGDAAWWFITLPHEDSADIQQWAADKKSAWGSIKVTATIGTTSWQTSLFPDSKVGGYLLPVKAAVRKKEQLEANRDAIEVHLQIG